MKVGRIVCGVILTLLCVFGWVYQISAITDSRNAWQETVAAAQNFRDQKLYQRAIRSYEEALTIREDATLFSRTWGGDLLGTTGGLPSG